MRGNKSILVTALLVTIWLLPGMTPAYDGEEQLRLLAAGPGIDFHIRVETQGSAWNIFVSREGGGEGSAGEHVRIRLVPVEGQSERRSGKTYLVRRAVKVLGLTGRLVSRLAGKWIF